jgi:hypothetical protein
VVMKAFALALDFAFGGRLIVDLFAMTTLCKVVVVLRVL